MENKKQIVHVHGGDAFRDPERLYSLLRQRTVTYGEEKKRWRDDISEKLEATHELHAPSMPNPQWADYEAWKIWFEKGFPFLRDNIILIGHSLGGGFLLRYLTENKMPVTISQLHIVAGVVDEKDLEDVDGFTVDLSEWKGLVNEIGEIHLWYSNDDQWMPMHQGERLANAWPEATLHTFTDRGHFLQPEFPELLAEIKKIA